MGIFRKRPLSLAVCVSAGVALAAVYAGNRQKLILLACFLFGGLLLSILSILRRRVTAGCTALILTCAACACLLAGSWAWFGPTSDRYLSRTGETVAMEGYVTERLSAGGNGSRFAVRLTEFDGTPVRDCVLLECDYRSALSEGDRFRLTGQVRDFSRDESYDEETYLRSDGLVAVVTCSDYGDCTITGERTDTPMLALRRVNRRFCERLRSAVGGEEGALICALLLGNRSALSDATVLHFRRSGISHLLALSGLHVSILIGILEWILGRFRVPKRIRIAAVPPLAIFYLILTGAAVSTVRSVLMVAVLSLAFLSAERYDSFTALSVALFCILAVTPYAVLDLSLWLSFGAAASIIVFMPAVRSIPHGRLWRFLPRPVAKAWQGLVTAVATGLFATCGTLGISVLFTHRRRVGLFGSRHASVVSARDRRALSRIVCTFPADSADCVSASSAAFGNAVACGSCFRRAERADSADFCGGVCAFDSIGVRNACRGDSPAEAEAVGYGPARIVRAFSGSRFKRGSAVR